MIVYLDASALVKLVVREAESTGLRRHLRRYAQARRVTSALSRVEVVRAVLPGAGPAIGAARRLLGAVDQVALGPAVLDDAATLSPTARLRSLDAIHLATARLFGADLQSLITYDARLAEAAGELGIAVVAPT